MNKAFLNRMCIIVIFCALLISVPGCQGMYYKTMEKVGYHKRDIMVDRVRDARDAQEEAKEQFKSALEKFNSVLNYKGGELEDKYNQLSEEYDRSEGKAKAVRERIDAVENVAEALFDEWKEELNQYSNDSLRRSSEQKLLRTRKQYTQLMNAMKRAEKKIAPVLTVFHDQVLFLKHNLNAQAILSLKNELVSVESDVASLIREMEKSIGEADLFIQSMIKEQ